MATPVNPILVFVDYDRLPFSRLNQMKLSI